VRVVVITGAGNGFCSGSDLISVEETGGSLDKDTGISERIQPILPFALPLYNIPKPVIAAVNGIAAGAGLSIALLSDIRIASEKAKFSFIFIRRATIPDCGISFLAPRLVGTGKAFELMYTGDIIDAKEAERIGLVNRVVSANVLMEETYSLAEKLAKGAPLALAQTKNAIHRGLSNEFEEQLYFETYAVNFCFATEDSKEALNAFLEKREPRFKGR
jgi:2-(1,2-epoxy-1,2-dihydrophenyl)acetyl-CoA isomerase